MYHFTFVLFSILILHLLVDTKGDDLVGGASTNNNSLHRFSVCGCQISHVVFLWYISTLVDLHKKALHE